VPDVSSKNIAPAKPPGHDQNEPNPNIEFRNPKQIQSKNDPMLQTTDNIAIVRILFRFRYGFPIDR
ncbi:MAG: hypothetical protein LJE65_09080, partial [Desulfobacteraceae bacterium]|nr:hypothetical protein [Desulfobacteraceae bacterium]